MTKNVVLALFLMGAAVPSAQAAVGLAVDNLANAADTWNTDISAANYAAGGFTTGAVSTWMDRVDLALSSSSSGTLSLSLYGDNGNNRPDMGTLVSTFTSPGVIGAANNYTFTVATGAALTASTSYWLVASATANTTTWMRTADTAEVATYTGWTMNDNRGWSTNSGGAWSSYGSAQQFAVYADNVPEPEALAGVMMTGMFGLVALKRRRRTQVEKSSNTVTA